MIIEATSLQGGYIQHHFEISDSVTLPINWKSMPVEAKLEWSKKNASDQWEFARKIDVWHTTDVVVLPNPLNEIDT